jgi:peptidyl-prolyl cis-trans isomerase C
LKLSRLSPVSSGLFFILLVFSIAGCDLKKSRIANRPVVQVNDSKLTAQDFSTQLARRLKNFDALPAKDAKNVQRAKDDIVQVFIMQSLVANYAKNHGMTVTEEEIEKEVNKFRSSYPDDLSFRRALADENVSILDWKEELKNTLLERKVLIKLSEKLSAPTNEEIKQYYDENKERFHRKERVYVRQIIVDDLAKAQSIREEIRRKDFKEMARKYSVSSEAKAGGLVGWIERGTVDIFDKAFTLPDGGTSPVLESPYGFHIFRVEKKSPAGFVPISEVKEQIIQSIMGKKEQAEFAGWLDKQIRAAKVLKDIELLSAISVETREKK